MTPTQRKHHKFLRRLADEIWYLLPEWKAGMEIDWRNNDEWDGFFIGNYSVGYGPANTLVINALTYMGKDDGKDEFDVVTIYSAPKSSANPAELVAAILAHYRTDVDCWNNQNPDKSIAQLPRKLRTTSPVHTFV